MAYVPVPKDLSRIKTKVAFNLTKRQLIFFAAALLMGLPLFFLLKDSAGTSLAAFVMILVMLPCFLFAMYEKHGQPLETLIKNIIQTKFIRPKERPYRYYKTSHTDSFLSISTVKGSVRLESDEFFSTAKQPGAMALHLSSLFQDTAIYPLMQAQQHDLTAATWYVAEGQLDAVLHALKGLGYSVTATNERLLSTKLPLYFLFIPAFMLCVSIVFYTLSAGKKNVLKKMEGYTTGNILLGEIKAFAPALCLCFLLIFAAAMICAVWLHPVATWQFGLFLLGDCLWLLVPLILGILLSLLFLSGQRSAEYVKGKVPKRGIYITNTLAKAAFLIFNRLEWQTRCEFNAYCKRALRNELIDACRERKRRQLREVIFSDLNPQEERQLYTVDKYFQDGNEEAFCAGGLKITAKLLAEALHTLPDEKRQAVLLYYFFNMTDVEIAEAMKIPRSTVQYRRTSSFELLKRYLEERADEWND